VSPRELEQAIQDAFDGQLDEARMEQLRAELSRSPTAVDAYCDHALMESELRRYASGLGKIPGQIPASVRVAEHAQQRRRVAISLLSAAAVLLLSLFILQLVAIHSGQSLARLESSPGSVLTKPDGSTFTDAKLRKNDRLHLGQGVVRLRLDSGVEAVIEGPATLRLAEMNRLELAAGHAWFRVPREAAGFRVVSAEFEVVDLGTEFGIDQREDRPPEVHVLEGRVEAISKIGNRESTGLTAGQAASLAPHGRWQPIPAGPRKFRRNLPPTLPMLKIDFDTLDDGQITMSGDIIGLAGASARLIHSEGAALVPGVAGNAIELLGTGAHIETSWQGIQGSAPRTVAIWCRVPRGAIIQTAPPLVWWGDPAHGWNRKFKIALFRNPAGKTVMRASFGQVILDGSRNLEDGEWHHLAVVYRGNRPDGDPDIRFYIDGATEEILPTQPDDRAIETDTQSERSGAMGIGKYELPETGRNPFLKAALDELHIFAGALDAPEIQRLAQRPTTTEKTR
jgi:ferric-dicitrate binding protein FerR (iron transport regulator)